MSYSMKKACIPPLVVLFLWGIQVQVSATILQMEVANITNGELFQDLFVGSSYTAAYGDYVSSATETGRQIWNSNLRMYVDSVFTYGAGNEGFTPNIRAYFPYEGDRGVQHTSQYWGTGFGDLNKVLYSAVSAPEVGTVAINLFADSGHLVELYDVDIAAWSGGIPTIIKVFEIELNREADGSNDGYFTKTQELFSTNVNAPGSGHLPVSFGPVQAASLRLEITGGTGGSLGISNVRFGQTPYDPNLIPPDPNIIPVDPDVVPEQNLVSGVYVFQLPTLDTNEMITSVDLSFYFNGPKGMPELDVYGLRHDSDPTIQVNDYWAGVYDSGAHLIQEMIIDEYTNLPAFISTNTTIGDSSLKYWLNDCYRNGAVGGDYVFVRVNWAVEGYSPSWTGWFEPQEGVNPPVLTATVGTIPPEIDPAKNPALSTIQHQPYRQFVRELFNWNPQWLAEQITQVTFGPDNLPYIRTAEYDVSWPTSNNFRGKNACVLTMNYNNNWAKVDFKSFVKQKYADWDGKYNSGSNTDDRIVFDDSGDAYMVIDTFSNLGKTLLLMPVIVGQFMKFL